MTAFKTVLGPGGTRREDAALTGPARIDGHWEGHLRCEGFVEIGPQGHVEGSLTCQQVLLRGRLTGPLQASERATLTDTAIVQGDIECPWLDVQVGAQLHGKVRVEQPAR